MDATTTELDGWMARHFDVDNYDDIDATRHAAQLREAVRLGWRTETELRDELREAIATGTETGSDVEPGAYISGGTWTAWGYGVGREGMISVTEDDL